MTERPGLSIFDNAAAATQEVAPSQGASSPAAAAGKGPTFPVARRGYDPSAVDRKFAALAAERARLAADLDEQHRRTEALEAELAALRERASENEAPTYAGLGGRASELLRLAEEQADEVLNSARTR